MRHPHDQDAASFNAIDDAERKALEQVSARSVVERRPCVGKAQNRRFGSIDFTAECYGRSDAPLSVPARGRLCLFERFFDVLKLAGHGRLPRGCDDAPPTMESSWRCPRRLDRAGRESRQTMPLQRPRRLRVRDSESAHLRVRLALPQKGEELRTGAVWRPCRNTISRCSLLFEFGGEGRNRTVDTTIFSRMLYQLSYLATQDGRS
jgi:hypothetical protein